MVVENMKVDRKAKFIIFFTIAILALGLSNIAAVFTGDLVSSSLPSYNQSDKLIALDNDNFSPTSVNIVYEEKKYVEEVNDTADNNDTNSTDTDTNSDDSENKKPPSDDSDNQKPVTPDDESGSGGQSDGDDEG